MKLLRGLLLVLFSLVLFSCAMFETGDSEQKKAIAFMDIYNQQYDDYLAVARSPDLTEDQRVTLRKKKSSLTTLHTAIQLYNAAISRGCDTTSAERNVINLINLIGEGG